MQDHGLFQAICRVNRLHGDDKEYGYIVDYKDLFRSLEQAITEYTGEAFENYDTEDVKGLLKDRLQQAKATAGRRHARKLKHCVNLSNRQKIPPLTSVISVVKKVGNLDQLKANEQKRIHLYKMAAAFLRAYSNLANEMKDAGYTDTDINEIKTEVTHYENVRQEIKLASGDYVDLKVYEPDMRHLLDTYIRAKKSETLSNFDNIPLVQLLVQDRDAAIGMLPAGIRNDETAIAATIENNVRRLIVDKSDINPKYYENMSKLLEDLIRQRKQGTMDYRAHLIKIAELSAQINEPENQLYSDKINTGALRALFDNLGDMSADRREEIALTIDIAIRRTKKHDWRGTHAKKMDVRNAIAKIIDDKFSDDNLDLNTIFELVINQNDY